MAKIKKNKNSLLSLEISIGGISLIQKSLFAKNISVMLKSGLSLTEALNVAQESASGRFKKIIGEILRSVEAGSSLSKAFSRYPKIFSGFFIGATYAGETSGNLTENLENVAERLRKEQEMVSKVKGAMLYPAVVLAVAFVFGLFLAYFILPNIVPLFEGFKKDLPASTKALIWFSHLVQEKGFYLLFGIIGFFIFMGWLLRQKFIFPLTHLILLKAPIIKDITKNTNLARFCGTLGSLLKSGMNIDEAFEITEKTTGNYYYRRALQKISKNIQKGTKISDNLDEFSNLFPKIATRMIKVGEESGRFEETFLYLESFYESKVDNSVKSLSTLIEPVLLIIVGLLVAFLFLSIITPIYQFTSGMRIR